MLTNSGSQSLDIKTQMSNKYMYYKYWSHLSPPSINLPSERPLTSLEVKHYTDQVLIATLRQIQLVVLSA